MPFSNSTHIHIASYSPSIPLTTLVQQMAASPSPLLLISRFREDAEAFAQVIHRTSSRAAQPFIISRCGLYKPSLLERRFFGRDAGLSRAHFRRVGQPGLVEQAHHGTLYVEQLQLATQSMQDGLLRLLQGTVFCDPLTGHAAESDVRIIATVPGPIGMFAAGRINLQLAQRLNLVSFQVPPCFAINPQFAELLETPAAPLQKIATA